VARHGERDDRDSERSGSRLVVGAVGAKPGIVRVGEQRDARSLGHELAQERQQLAGEFAARGCKARDVATGTRQRRDQPPFHGIIHASHHNGDRARRALRGRRFRSTRRDNGINRHAHQLHRYRREAVGLPFPAAVDQTERLSFGPSPCTHRLNEDAQVLACGTEIEPADLHDPAARLRPQGRRHACQAERSNEQIAPIHVSELPVGAAAGPLPGRTLKP
jgi:hypothetical protein